MELLDIIRDECAKLDKRLAYIGITSLCTAEYNAFVGGIVLKLQITNIDGTKRYSTWPFSGETIPHKELRPRIRYTLRQLSFEILDEENE